MVTILTEPKELVFRKNMLLQMFNNKVMQIFQLKIKFIYKKISIPLKYILQNITSYIYKNISTKIHFKIKYIKLN